MNDDFKCACAHLRVGWTTEDDGSGLRRGWWECENCGILFSPATDLAAIRAENSDLKEKAEVYAGAKEVIDALRAENALLKHDKAELEISLRNEWVSIDEYRLELIDMREKIEACRGWSMRLCCSLTCRLVILTLRKNSMRRG